MQLNSVQFRREVWSGEIREDNKFEVKDNEQSIQNSKMKTEGGSENNVKNKDVEDGDLKKSIQTSDV